MADRSQTIPADARSVLVVLPTWVGDFVMATPILRAVRARFGGARITFLAEPNLLDLIRGGPWMDEVIEWPEKSQRSLMHRAYRRLVGELRSRSFDVAVLLPNSFRAALIARLAGARRRVGYDRDGRGFLLTDRVPVRNRRVDVERRIATGGSRGQTSLFVASGGGTGGQATSGTRRNPSGGSGGQTGLSVAPGTEQGHGQTSLPMPPGTDREQVHTVRERHTVPEGGTGGPAARGAEFVPPKLPVKPSRFVPMRLTTYYDELAVAIGCDRPGDKFELFTTADCDEAVAGRLVELGIADGKPLVVLSPGAKYGAAKCWMPDRFAKVADRLVDEFGAAVLVTCGPGEEHIARAIGHEMQRESVVLDDPRLSLGELKSLIKRSHLLICNDAGPRHFAKAFDVPVVTVFGPTHPEWTATEYPKETIVRVDVDCGPCQQRTCPLGHRDCMTGVTVDAVYAAAAGWLRTAKSSPVSEPSRG